MSHQHMALAKKAAGHLRLSVDHVAELDLLLPELLLVLLQPGLVVLDEEVDGVSLRQESGPVMCDKFEIKLGKLCGEERSALE